MALIIEDGTGVTDANAYISAAEFTTYTTNRNKDISGYTNEQIEGAIVVASADFISVNYMFSGDALTETQGMQLPTVNVDINRDIKKATCEATLLQLSGKLFVSPDDVSAQGSISLERKKLDTLETEVEYHEGASYTNKYPTTRNIDMILLPYLSSGGYAPTVALRL